ncbi:MAG TPA: response regulator [Candidatus Binatia bacterium]|jgi:CheY-like chemotaxis protein
MSLTTKKILLVEDHAVTMQIVQYQLDFIGVRNVLTASSAQEALQIADAESPDLILMDIVLPDMSGLEATRKLKANPRTRMIPVVAITGRATREDGELCLESGCTGYLPKPVSIQHLKKAIEDVFPT